MLTGGPIIKVSLQMYRTDHIRAADLAALEAAGAAEMIGCG